MALTSTIQDLFYQEARIKRYPVSVNFELLPVCNLRCKMCYIQTDMNHVKAHGGLRSSEEWIALAREMRDSGTLFLLLSGGEAFLYPDFRKLYIELYKMGFWITINTNGTLIDESVVSWLKEYPPKIVSMSLYGASEETYQKVCGQKGVFSRVKHAIQLLAENHIRFELKTMYTPLNVEDWDQCWDLAARFGAYYEAANYAFPPARKANREGQIRFSASECAELAIRTNQRESKGNEYVQKVLNHLQKYEDTKGIPGGELYGFTCGATRSTCWITWQGHMTPCAMLEEPYTLPFEQGFSAAWEELKEKCDRILMSPKCSHCDKRAVCTVCPAACYAETGSFEKHSPYHCRMTEYTLESMERQVKEWGIEDRIVRRNEEK